MNHTGKQATRKIINILKRLVLKYLEPLVKDYLAIQLLIKNNFKQL